MVPWAGFRDRLRGSCRLRERLEHQSGSAEGDAHCNRYAAGRGTAKKRPDPNRDSHGEEKNLRAEQGERTMGPGSNIAVTQPVDSSILHEIVRVVESRRKVPERVQVRAREYLITYLEDHQRRLEEALQRYDSDRLNMLYGQLASKIKYQLLRRLPGASTTASRPMAKEKKQAPPKVKAKAKATSKPKPTPKPKKAEKKKKSLKSNRAATVRGRSTKPKSARIKTGKPAKRVAARKAKPVRAGKRGSKRKPPKK